MRITLKEAARFHGHLGPYLVLGLLAGELALKKLNAKKYSGLEIKVYGANEKPKSCLIDGLQLSTGATYGKGNIQKIKGNKIRLLFSGPEDKRRLKICFKDSLVRQLNRLKGHGDSERFASLLLRTDIKNLFEFKEG